MATWWVGFFAAWFIARVTVPALPRATAFRLSLRGFAIVFGFAFAAAVVGYLLGLRHGADYSTWEYFAATLRVEDLPSFVRVAYIHNASYLGGFIGLVAAVIYVRRIRNAGRCAGGNAPSPRPPNG